MHDHTYIQSFRMVFTGDISIRRKCSIGISIGISISIRNGNISIPYDYVLCHIVALLWLNAYVATESYMTKTLTGKLASWQGF